MVVTINAPERIDYLGAVAVEVRNGQVKSLFNVPVFTPNEVIPLHPIEQLFYPVTDSNNSTRRLVSLFYSGSDGARPSSDSVYYGVFPLNVTRSWDLGPYGTNPVLNQSQLTFLGSLNDYHQLYHLNLPSSQVCTQGTNPCDDQIYLGLYSSNSTLLYSMLMPEADVYPPPAPLVPSNDLAAEFFTNSLGIFVPLLAILGSFTSYGKDRVSGILESVLSRPVTRRGLVSSRLLSIFMALGIAVVVSVGAMDIIIDLFNKSFVSSTLLVGASATLLVELAVFIELMLLVSHLVRSNSQLIGAGLALFLGLGFLASLVVAPIAGLLGAAPGSVGYIQATIISDFLNPAQLISLVIVYLTHQVPGYGIPVQPAAYGVTILTITVAMTLWIMAPLAVLLLVVRKRD